MIRRDDNHVYYIDSGILSRAMPGITGILKKAGLADLKHIPKEILEMAATRGTRVHDGMESVIRGDVPEILTHDVRQRIENGMRYLDATHPGHAIVSEYMTAHPEGWYGCTLDLVCHNCGTVEEWKTSQRVFSSHHAQVTAQRMASYKDYAGRIVLLLPDRYVPKPADNRPDLVAYALGTYYEVVKKWGPGPPRDALVAMIEEAQ